MTITLPTKPHLKKFILKVYGPEPIKVREDSNMGRHIMSILIDKREAGDNHNDQYTERLKISLSQDMSKRSPRIKKLLRLNFFIDNDFKESLYIWVFGQINAGINPYNATRNFCEHFNFDETEYTHDAAQRAWLRYINKEYAKKKKDKTKGVDSVTKKGR